MKIILKSIFLFATVLLLHQGAFGQCNTFTKNTCQPKLGPYIYNGQLNSAVLNEGDVAELMLTFYSNQEYRIVVCAADEIGAVNFRLLDSDRQVIFSNADHGMIDHWDFHTNSTQKLTIEVSVPESDTEPKYRSGCVSILVGFLDNQ